MHEPALLTDRACCVVHNDVFLSGCVIIFQYRRSSRLYRLGKELTNSYVDRWQTVNAVSIHKPVRFRQRHVWRDGNRTRGHPISNNSGIHSRIPFSLLSLLVL